MKLLYSHFFFSKALEREISIVPCKIKLFDPAPQKSLNRIFLNAYTDSFESSRKKKSLKCLRKFSRFLSLSGAYSAYVVEIESVDFQSSKRFLRVFRTISDNLTKTETSIDTIFRSEASEPVFSKLHLCTYCSLRYHGRE